MRLFSTVAAAIVLCATAPAFADAQSHVQAARKAERRNEWQKALAAWKAAYSSDVNAEYLIGIGDAYAHLGNKTEAKKNYEAYLADPLALPANVEKVKTRIAALDSPIGGALALPGGPGLALPGAPPPLPGADAAAPPPLPGGPGLELPGPAVAETKRGKKGRKGAEPPPSLPGLELPGAAPVQVAKADAPPGGGLALPGLELPAAQPAKPEKKTAAASAPLLDLPGASPAKPERKEQPAVASNTPPATKASATRPPAVAMATPVVQAIPAAHHVPDAALPSTPPHQAEASGGSNKTVAYVAAGVALVALGGGAFAFTQAGSAHSELTGKIHSGAEAQSLLESESKNKTLSFVGFAGGLVAAGIATALFAF